MDYQIDMCGILFYILNSGLSLTEKERVEFYKQLQSLVHRGPDFQGVISGDSYIAGHNRLAIVDSKSGSQPIHNGTRILVANGEIFSHNDVRRKYDFNYNTNSDCEVIIPSVLDDVYHFDGQYAYVMYDTLTKKLTFTRDESGIVPLYIGMSDRGLWISSEIKSLIDNCKVIKHVTPGHVYSFDSDMPMTLVDWLPKYNRKSVYNRFHLRDVIKRNVLRQLPQDEDIGLGFFLSGGLDSSLIASIASRHLKHVRTFSIGMKDSKDLYFARKVAEFLKTDHTEVIYDESDIRNTLKLLIYHLETFDTTTIRASLPMFLLAKHASKQGIKVCMSGEGADELFGGYLYMKNAPTEDEFQCETERLYRNLYMFDCLRANKSTMAHSIETRVPLLSREVVNYVLNLSPHNKYPAKNNGIEKYILRDAFNTPEDPYLPADILWRKKEAFSDGVGSSSVRILKELAKEYIVDEPNDETQYHETPLTQVTHEEAMYMQIYKSLFGHTHMHLTKEIWRPRWTDIRDPSATLLADYDV